MKIADNECPNNFTQMQFELSTSFSKKVTSLVTGNAVDFPFVLDFGHLFALPFYQFLEEYGLTAVDRLYPLKPKNPI